MARTAFWSVLLSVGRMTGDWELKLFASLHVSLQLSGGPEDQQSESKLELQRKFASRTTQRTQRLHDNNSTTAPGSTIVASETVCCFELDGRAYVRARLVGLSLEVAGEC
jgi:hypothetical protein